MIHIHGYDHIVLRTVNLQVMLDFYTQVLGCALERQLDPSIGLYQLRAGEAMIDLVDCDSRIGRQGGAAPDPQRRNLDHFCLQLTDFDEAELRAHLSRHGIAAGPMERRYGAQGDGDSMYIQDPDGNTIELKGRC